MQHMTALSVGVLLDSRDTSACHGIGLTKFITLEIGQHKLTDLRLNRLVRYHYRSDKLFEIIGREIAR